MQVSVRKIQKGLIVINEEIVNAIVDEIKDRFSVMIEASGRHIHLSREDADKLFGKGYTFTIKKELSQPGQFAYEERVTLTGPKGVIRNVAILGPCRKETQVEISLTDARVLGIDAPVRLSGDISNTPGCTVSSPSASVEIKQGVIIAKRHIHLTPEDAARFNVKDNDSVKLKIYADRPVIFEDLIARISKQFSTAVHIDYDEANACGFKNGCRGLIIQ